jgi:hypothetical protein
MPDGRRSWIARTLLLAVVALLAGLAWDVHQLRSLRPPDDRSLDGFLAAGRRPSALHLDDVTERLAWTAPFPPTILPHADPPVYLFDRAGCLVDWTPGGEPGMFSGAPIPRRGREATLEQARAWLKR